MSLESQLTSKAAAVFNKEYQAIFNKFYKDISSLTGIDITNTYTRTKEDIENLGSFITFQNCAYQGDSQMKYLKDKHKELFIAEFIRKTEELQEYVSTQEQGN